jgi:hypothetical protein
MNSVSDISTEYVLTYYTTRGVGYITNSLISYSLRTVIPIYLRLLTCVYEVT